MIQIDKDYGVYINNSKIGIIDETGAENVGFLYEELNRLRLVEDQKIDDILKQEPDALTEEEIQRKEKVKKINFVMHKALPYGVMRKGNAHCHGCWFPTI